MSFSVQTDIWCDAERAGLEPCSQWQHGVVEQNRNVARARKAVRSSGWICVTKEKLDLCPACARLWFARWNR